MKTNHHGCMDACAAGGLAIEVGQRYPVGERLFTLTPRLAEATLQAREVLAEVAQAGEVITYGELSEAIGGMVLPRHLGPLLAMIAHDCAARAEPELAALVVSATSGEVSTRDQSWAPPARQACWDYWGGSVTPCAPAGL